MSAMPSTKICAFCTRLVLLSRDKKTVAKHVNVVGQCGGSGKTVEEHDRVKKELSVFSVRPTTTPAQTNKIPDQPPEPRKAVSRKRGTR